MFHAILSFYSIILARNLSDATVFILFRHTVIVSVRVNPGVKILVRALFVVKPDFLAKMKIMATQIIDMITILPKVNYYTSIY